MTESEKRFPSAPGHLLSSGLATRGTLPVIRPSLFLDFAKCQGNVTRERQLVRGLVEVPSPRQYIDTRKRLYQIRRLGTYA